MMARTRYRWGGFIECGHFLYGKWFALTLKGDAYDSYVRPVIP